MYYIFYIKDGERAEQPDTQAREHRRVAGKNKENIKQNNGIYVYVIHKLF